MHCLKPIHDSLGELSITLIPSNDIHRINIQEWRKLQSDSLVNNPFFEDWNLIPALKYLATDENIFIVTVYSGRKMVALFPIVKYKTYSFIPSLSIWQHNHAYKCDPLFTRHLDWSKVFNHVASYLNCIMTHIPNHRVIEFNSESSTFTTPYCRAAIHTPKSIRPHVEYLSGKKNRELQRINRKIKKDLACKFVEIDDLSLGLEIYKSIEHKGWKGINKGSILSNTNVSSYYNELIQDPEKKHIQVFGLTTNGKFIACAIRITSQNHIYEIKTSYDETFRNYAPGKSLEWYLLNHLSQQKFDSVDSCTHSQNTLINWLWPDQITYYRSYLFTPNLMGRLASRLHTFKQWFNQRYTHA